MDCGVQIAQQQVMATLRLEKNKDYEEHTHGTINKALATKARM